MTELRSVPRVELHCHLDASMRLDTIEGLARDAGLSYDRPVAEVASVTQDCRSLPELLRALDVQIDVLQTPDAIEQAAYELGQDFANDGIIHGEVRFGPHLHQRNGDSIETIISAAARGLRLAERESGLSTALIVCALRHHDPEESVELAEVARNRSDLVDGFDIAGPEAGFPASPFREAFEIAASAGIGITAHAGEAAGPESVREALALGATRIGHGVRSVEDKALVAELAREGITLECAPTCNVYTRVVPSIGEHPIDQLFAAGVRTTVNTDVRTCLGLSLNQELATVVSELKWSRDRLIASQIAAAQAAFVDDDRRAELIRAIEASRHISLS